LTVVGDVPGKNKGGKNGGKDGGKDGGDTSAVPAPQPLPETSKVTDAPKQTNPQRTETAKNGNSDGGDKAGRRGKRGNGNFDASQFQGKGGGSFDPSQFKGKDGKIDREALRAQFQAKGGGGFDPSQFQGRNGGGNGGGRGGGGAAASAAGGGRGARGLGAPQQNQTVYRLNAKNEVEAVRVRTGLSDGNWIQLLGNTLVEGAELITAVDGLPAPAGNANKANQGFPGNNNQNKNFNQGFRF
jgi:hypothetical protein